VTKVTGELVRVDLGAGGWIVKTRRGDVELFGDVPASLAGEQVEVTGSAVEGFGTVMSGASRALEVQHIKRRG
jgi:hypothetical protein